jgi:hypothetical protein
MGILCDLVVGTTADIEKIGESQVPSREFDGIDIKGIDSVKFGTLHSILTGEEFESLLPQYEPVYVASDEGPWVFQIPDSLTSRLASLTSTGRAQLAEQWGGTEEFGLDGWTPSDVAPVLDAICTLAASAETSERSLFLWMSL